MKKHEEVMERLKSRFVQIENAINKTVDRVYYDCGILSIMWSDGTYSHLHADEDDLDEGPLSMWDSLVMRQIGLVSQEDILNARESLRMETEEKQRGEDLANYNRLKAKLGL